jgi:hypothetical protein
MIPRIYTMAIFVNLKYFGKEQANNLDVEKVCQKCIKIFTSISLTIVAHAFDFIANLNIDYSMSREDADKTSGTHTSLPTSYLGLQNAILITSKCLLKLSSKYLTQMSKIIKPYKWTLP